jgi:hypothetical protein
VLGAKALGLDKETIASLERAMLNAMGTYTEDDAESAYCEHLMGPRGLFLVRRGWRCAWARVFSRAREEEKT